MTVKELIDELSAMPQDHPVVVCGPGQAGKDNDPVCYPIGDVELVTDVDTPFICFFLEED